MGPAVSYIVNQQIIHIATDSPPSLTPAAVRTISGRCSTRARLSDFAAATLGVTPLRAVGRAHAPRLRASQARRTCAPPEERQETTWLTPPAAASTCAGSGQASSWSQRGLLPRSLRTVPQPGPGGLPHEGDPSQQPRWLKVSSCLRGPSSPAEATRARLNQCGQATAEEVVNRDARIPLAGKARIATGSDL